MAAESQDQGSETLDQSHAASKTEGHSSLLLFPATELAERICKGEITAEAAMCEYIKRIKSVNQDVNAVVANRFEVGFHNCCHSVLTWGGGGGGGLYCVQAKRGALFGDPILFGNPYFTLPMFRIYNCPLQSWFPICCLHYYELQRT